MPKLQRTNYSQEFDAYSRKAFELNERNDCAVKAVAIATGSEYETVHKLMTEFGRKQRRGTHDFVTTKTLTALGFKIVRVDIQSIIEAFPRPHCDVLKNLTTHHPRRFPGCVDPNKSYLAWVNGHILAIKGGVVHDWTVNRSLRIISLYEVVPA